MDFFVDFFENFDKYVAPLNPWGVFVGVFLSGAIGGAAVAAQANKKAWIWAVRGAFLSSLCAFVGANISSEVGRITGSGLSGLVIGWLVGCMALCVFVIASNE